MVFEKFIYSDKGFMGKMIFTKVVWEKNPITNDRRKCTLDRKLDGKVNEVAVRKILISKGEF